MSRVSIPQPERYRVYLQIPKPWEPGWRQTKDTVKALGAKFDPIAKRWWVDTRWGNTHLFSAWLTTPVATPAPRPQHTCPGCGTPIDTHVAMCSSCREVHPTLHRRSRRPNATDRFLRTTNPVRFTVNGRGEVLTQSDFSA